MGRDSSGAAMVSGPIRVPDSSCPSHSWDSARVRALPDSMRRRSALTRVGRATVEYLPLPPFDDHVQPPARRAELSMSLTGKLTEIV